MAESLATSLVRVLGDAGISVCFANPGTTELPLVGALAASSVRSVLCLHEGVATAAADGYGRVVSRPAATLLHLGPGLANGVANLHNARRASSPILNVVGEMPTWHRNATGSILSFDIPTLAATVCASTQTLEREGVLDLATVATPLCGENNTQAVLVPYDLQSEPAAVVRKDSVRRGEHPPLDVLARDLSHKRAAIYVGGIAATSRVLRSLAKLGLPILIENAFGRVDRGVGMPQVMRMPYWSADQAAELAKYECILVVGGRVPQALFGFNGQSELLDRNTTVHRMIVEGARLAELIDELATLVAKPSALPDVAAYRPTAPVGALTATKLCQAIAAVQPEGAIVVDESITTGGSYWALSEGCPPFSHLGLAGGSIGYGPGASVGAAIASGGRPVINIQADGSALYAIQALWTQARERLNVVTVICANRSYNILKIEMARDPELQRAADRFTPPSVLDLTNPSVDWCRLASGLGVRAHSTNDAAQLHELLLRAIHSEGPTLIEAVL